MIKPFISELLDWIHSRNASIHVSINRIPLDDCQPWYYDSSSGRIRNPAGSFFQIAGLRVMRGGETVLSQPIILQDEIGYLGILCRRFGGEMHYLMQAKIEPGNVNQVQLSPTIQATKSNFTQKHGGARPAYLDYFINASKYRIIADQIQSEQSSRFLCKRNRNIILEVDEEIEVLPSHMWLTLPQIKELTRYDNLVNMDTRTVLSCLPLDEEPYFSQIKDPALRASVRGGGRSRLPEIYNYLNDSKMFDERLKNKDGVLFDTLLSEEGGRFYHGRGENVRDWLYVEDHCKAIDLIIRKAAPGAVYNIGGHNEMRNIDIVKLICKKLGKPESLITYVTDRKGHDMRYAIVPTKIHTELGWWPETKFEDGIQKTIRWYLDNRAWWEEILSGEYQTYYRRMYGNREEKT